MLLDGNSEERCSQDDGVLYFFPEIRRRGFSFSTTGLCPDSKANFSTELCPDSLFRQSKEKFSTTELCPHSQLRNKTQERLCGQTSRNRHLPKPHPKCSSKTTKPPTPYRGGSRRDSPCGTVGRARTSPCASRMSNGPLPPICCKPDT